MKTLTCAVYCQQIFFFWKTIVVCGRTAKRQMAAGMLSSGVLFNKRGRELGSGKSENL